MMRRRSALKKIEIEWIVDDHDDVDGMLGDIQASGDDADDSEDDAHIPTTIFEVEPGVEIDIWAHVDSDEDI